MTEIAQQISSLGGTVILAALFVWQFIQERTHNREREEKLYKVIETLSERMPGIEAALTRIERSIENGRQ